MERGIDVSENNGFLIYFSIFIEGLFPIKSLFVIKKAEFFVE